MKLEMNSLKTRLALLFILFFLLVTVSAAVTIWSLEDQKQDAVTINLAGRQRMLLQRMEHEASKVRLAKDEVQPGALIETIQHFDRTLSAFQKGGLAPYLSGQEIQITPVRNDAIQAQLAETQQVWEDYRENLEFFSNQIPGSGESEQVYQTIQQMTPGLIEKADGIVRLYEKASSDKVMRLRWLQAGFLVAGLGLLAAGAWVFHRSALEPLRKLGAAARRIGDGDLGTPVEIAGLKEIREQAESLDEMRLRLMASQEELLAWTGSLEQRVAQRTEELEAVYSVSREISSHLDINQVLESVTQKTRQLLNVDVVFLCLLDKQGNVMGLRAASGPEAAIAATSSSTETPTVKTILAQDCAIHCDDTGCQGFCHILSDPYRQYHLAAPLRIGRQVIGALCVGSASRDRVDSEAAEILTKLANVTAVALQNAQLYEQAERAAILEERGRMAAEMHDGLAQTLSYMRITVDQAMIQMESGKSEQAMLTLDRLHEGLVRAVEDTRRAIASLQEQGPVRESLQQLIEGLVAEFNSNGLKVNSTLTIKSPLYISRQESEQVYRVVREALLNAERHAQATSIEIRLECAEQHYRVDVSDNGIGFSTEVVERNEKSQHYGLNIMRARAARLGGDVSVHSEPGSGTLVGLSWPVKAGENETRVV